MGFHYMSTWGLVKDNGAFVLGTAQITLSRDLADWENGSAQQTERNWQKTVKGPEIKITVKLISCN